MGIQGLCWKGSLAFFWSLSLSVQRLLGRKKQNSAAAYGVYCCTVNRNHQRQPQEPYASDNKNTAGPPTPPNSHHSTLSSVLPPLLLTYGRAMAGRGGDHMLHRGAFWQSHSSIGSEGGGSYAGNDTDEDQAQSLQGSSPCWGEKLFSAVLIYWSMTWA